MTARDRIREAIRRRAHEIRAARRAGRGAWAWLRSWLAGVSDDAEQRLDERDESQTRANVEFLARRGFSERDLLPGGRYDKMRAAGTLTRSQLRALRRGPIRHRSTDL